MIVVGDSSSGVLLMNQLILRVVWKPTIVHHLRVEIAKGEVGVHPVVHA